MILPLTCRSRAAHRLQVEPFYFHLLQAEKMKKAPKTCRFWLVSGVSLIWWLFIQDMFTVWRIYAKNAAVCRSRAGNRTRSFFGSYKIPRRCSFCKRRRGPPHLDGAARKEEPRTVRGTVPGPSFFMRRCGRDSACPRSGPGCGSCPRPG